MKNPILYFLLIFSFYSFSQEQEKDTLFIKYDNSLLTKYTEPIDKYNYYLIKGTENQKDLTFLQEEKKYTNLKHNKTLCLKNILKKSNSYYERGKVRNERLANYLGQYVIFLVKQNEYIKVGIVQETE